MGAKGETLSGNSAIHEVEDFREWMTCLVLMHVGLNLRMEDCSLLLFLDAIEEVLNGGPWYVGGFVIGLDKWTPNFSPHSLDGISSPIWKVRRPDCLPPESYSNLVENTAEIKGRDEVVVSINSNLLSKPDLAHNTNVEFNVSGSLDADNTPGPIVTSPACMPKIAEVLNFQTPQEMEAVTNECEKDLNTILAPSMAVNPSKEEGSTGALDNTAESLGSLDLNFKIPPSMEAVKAVDTHSIPAGLKSVSSMDSPKLVENSNFQVPNLMEAVMEKVVEEQVTVLIPSKADNISGLHAFNDFLGDGCSNSISPSSTTSLKFNKTILFKGNKSTLLSDSKPKLFKELQGLGPMKDQSRRRIVDHKVKNGSMGSSQKLSI
ncbi:hypothetical protein KFK09_001652 [Dendrobium nobile]|uniref:DUF4283 domain-containing protein n=1 Tax=Dendrobium nobile TaxID=94219 RepID=A0A8T3CBH4_DENNO|nr:hypothetical protein KFK09_001652 [Dendrobium nobile]